ncbi:MAG: mechanosensitive ion channel family protein [Chromatiales bacterium]|nr:mechanosensitive ion channel family protein [Gammaproteobacteria bacterium]MCP5352452.1 mechanosensitive ion channel family protein [Chromatiales bacterium]
MKPLRRIALLLLTPCILFAGATLAADKGVVSPPTWHQEAEKSLKAIQAEVARWAAPDSTEAADMTVVDRQIADLLRLRGQAEQCVTGATNDLASVNAKLEAIGAVGEDESREIKQHRATLDTAQRDHLQRLAVCRLIDLGAKDTLASATGYRNAALSKALFSRAEPLWVAVQALLLDDAGAPARRSLSGQWLPAAGSFALLMLLLFTPSLYVSRRLRAFAQQAEGPSAAHGLARMYALRLPTIATMLAISAGLAAGGLAALAAPTLFFAAAMALAPLLEQLVCRDQPHCREGLPARLLLVLVLLASAMLLVDVQAYLPGNLDLTLRGVFLVVLAMSALWLLLRVSQHPDMGSLRGLRLPFALLLIVGPTADWIGYRALGELLTLGVYGTLTGAFLTRLAYLAIGTGLDRLEEGGSSAALATRKFLGYAPDEPMAGMRLLRRLVAFGLLLGYGYWLLAVWQVTDAEAETARGVLGSGFDIGGLHIVPARLVQALLIFLALWWVAGWLRRQMGERWLVKTKLDSGARQSIVMLTSYVLIGAAILIGLSVAGLEFQNLAIIAGALSVGIGFGLQNIVNNFVSGLILLFERPVKPGDWVVVGNTEGYVRKVSIRSTLIQTFDRADVLVPNSELISNQVTNWMLNDTLGRVIVPVGVAYGTDTRKVRDILNKIAREHPLVITSDPRVSAPRVLFMAFGESSLDFELRVFIRDVDYRLSVRSDLLFAIDDAFRAANIEIPFPQRVVHMPAPPTADEPSA